MAVPAANLTGSGTSVPVHSMRCVTYLWVALAVALLNPREASAGGYYISDIGARGAARGGAFVAAPDSTYAIHYNPAGLSLLKGLHIDINLAFVDYQASFTRACPCLNPELRSFSGLDFDGIESELDGVSDRTMNPAYIPYIGVAYGFDAPMKPSIGFAVYGPMSGSHDYGTIDADTATDAFAVEAKGKPTRYLSLTAPNLEINYTLAASFEPIEGLRIGGMFNLYQVGVGQKLHLFVDSSLALRPEDTRYDVPLDINLFSDPEPSWGFGLSYDVPFIPGLSLGVSYRAQRNLTADGTVDVEIPQELVNIASVEGRNIELSLNLPAIFRSGIQYRLPNVFQAEVAFAWENWSSNRAIIIEPKDINFIVDVGGDSDPVQLSTIRAEKGWRDTWSLRVGGELELWEPWLGIRAGYFYEPSAIPQRRLDPSRIALDKNGYSLGLSTELGGFTFELTGIYIDLLSATITNSEVSNITIELDPEAVSQQSIQGNGRYSGRYWIGVFNVSFSLDAFNGDGSGRRSAP